jgi:hypothetical protein
MYIILSTIRNSPQLTRVWVRTGDARTPLACVWKQAPASVGAAGQSSPEDEQVVVRLSMEEDAANISWSIVEPHIEGAHTRSA